MDDLHQTVWERLKEGYGVEDITLMDDIPVEDVRRCVRRFRASRKLRALYWRARKKWFR